MARKITETKAKSIKIGTMAAGCRLCIKGLKEVIFITGICPKTPACYYCPISDKKKGKDVIYANEWPIEKIGDIITEARLCESSGAGITGGDPLSRFDRTIEVIKLLKKNFGEDFHIHLYTPLELVNEKKLKELEKAGLDEIRFHPDLDNKKLWEKIHLKTGMDKGIEIPVIPGKIKETKSLIDFMNGHVDFLNLNELEISDTNINRLYELGFRTKDDVSYAVKESREMALKLLDYCLDNTELNVHFCTVSLKDGVQLPKRIARRAKNIAQPFDRITSEGNLIRAAIYLPDLIPSFGYTRKLEEMKDKDPKVKELKKVRQDLIKEFGIPSRMILVDKLKLRLLTSEKIGIKYKDKIKSKNLSVAIVEELPTHDQFEIESQDL